MSALIDYAIPQGSFEIVRDALGLIIATELANQKTLRNDDDFDVTTYIERFLSYDTTELPIVNIRYNKTPYASKDLAVITGVNEFYIDVIVDCQIEEEEEVDLNKRGDSLARIKLHKILNCIRYILESKEYYNLSLPQGMIGNKYVANLAVFNPDTPYNANVSNDSYYVLGGRITFHVKTNDIIAELTSKGFKPYSILTTATIEETNKGYKVEVINN